MDGVKLSLAEGITQVLKSRGMVRRQLIERLPDQATRWAVYRLLSGRSFDPHFTTVLAICQALEVSPTELAQFSGMLEHAERGQLAHTLRLRAAVQRALGLDDEARELGTQLIEEVIGVLDRRRTGAAATPVRSRRRSAAK